MDSHRIISLDMPFMTWVRLGIIFLIVGSVFHSRSRGKDIKTPLTFPYLIPLLKSTIPFVFDGPNFFRKVLRTCQGEWPIRVALLGDDVFLVQGPKNVASIFSNPSLTVTRAYGIVLKHCFGMDQKAADVYVSDTSGSRQKPIPGSNVNERRRVSYHTHQNLLQGLLLTGLEPITERVEAALFESLDSIPKTEGWTHGADFTEFFEDHLGSSILKALSGPLLLADSPTFNRDLWNYDKQIMNLAKRLPAFCIPEAYRLRDKLLDSVLRWHQLANQRTAEVGEPEAGEDTDPFWGSEMMRERHKMLLDIEGQDPKSVASTDLGFIWATVTNVVPSTMTFSTQMFRDSSILNEIRESVQDSIQPGKRVKFDMKRLEKKPLLLSMYAETLRFGVQIHIPRCAPHQELHVGNKVIPKDKLVLVNTWVAHSDEEVWNTRDGTFPLDTFWSRRFLVDPKDPLSGPVWKHSKQTHQTHHDHGDDSVHFSIEGLDGAWIPYGGGQHACPGRVLAKRIMLLCGAMMAMMFDVEILAKDSDLRFGSPRFGFGVRKPAGQVPFRIRQRAR